MTNFIRQYRQQLTVAIIFFAAALMIVFSAVRSDIQKDDATYSMRSIGYLDYMHSQLQTTPLQWYAPEAPPAWSRLSFHDHPPVVFAVQWLTFRVFGVNDVSAKLPFVVASLGTLLIVYAIGKKLQGHGAGLAAMTVLGAMTFFTWAGHIGYLEPIMIFFVVVSLLLFLRARDDRSYWVAFGVAVGLAIMSKYTALFIVPAYAGYLLLFERHVLKQRHFWLAVVACAVVLSPQIIYNGFLYKTQGHFDVQLSILFGQDTGEKWSIISRQKDGINVVTNIQSLFVNILRGVSLPFFLALVASLALILLKQYRHRKPLEMLVLLMVLSMTAMFSITGAEPRFISLVAPFLALIAGIAVVYVFSIFENKQIEARVFIGVLCLVLGAEILYNFNTNLTTQPRGERGKHFSELRLSGNNFRTFEKEFIREKLGYAFSRERDIKTFADLNIDLSASPEVIVYDQDLNWFSSLWYLSKWSIYTNKIFISIGDVRVVLADQDWVEYFKESGAKKLYFVQGLRDEVLTSEPPNREYTRRVGDVFESRGATKTIYRGNDGQDAFAVYELTY